MSQWSISIHLQIPMAFKRYCIVRCIIRIMNVCFWIMPNFHSKCQLHCSDHCLKWAPCSQKIHRTEHSCTYNLVVISLEHLHSHSLIQAWWFLSSQTGKVMLALCHPQTLQMFGLCVVFKHVQSTHALFYRIASNCSLTLYRSTHGTMCSIHIFMYV